MQINQKFLRINREQLFKYFFFGVFLFLLYQLLRIAAPFFNAIFLALVLALIFFPLNLKIQQYLPEKPNLSAVIATLTVIFIFILPLMLLGWMMLKESRHIYPSAQLWLSNISAGIHSAPMENTIPPSAVKIFRKAQFITNHLDIDLKDMILKNIDNLQETISKSAGKIARNIIFFVVDFIAMIISLFLFFKDGKKLMAWIIELAPMDSEHKQAIALRLYETIIAVVRGVLLTAAFQGIVASLGYAIAGVPAPILLGIATATAALFPLGGSSLVWIPVGVIFMLMRDTAWGVFILLWGALVVGLLDNILRPILIGRQAKLPIILLFLGLFGGIRVYGIRGIFLGPILIACVLVFIQIYKQESRASAEETQK